MGNTCISVVDSRWHKAKPIKYCKVKKLKKKKEIQFSHWRVSDSLWPHGLQHVRLPCPSPTPGAYSSSCLSTRSCHPTILSFVIPSSPAFNLSQHQGLFKWVVSLPQVAKVLEFQLQHQSFQWIFRTEDEVFACVRGMLT